MGKIQENKMGSMPVRKVLFDMAVPMMISMLVQALYNVVDAVYVARLNENALNAVSLAFPLQNAMIAVASGTCLGMNALLSRYLGAKKREQVDEVAGTGIFLSLVSTVLFAIVGLTCAKAYFLSFTDVEEIVRYGTDYVTICLALSAGIFFQFCFERMLQATGRTRITMMTQLFGAIINIILDPILIFGLLGFPRMEVAGAAVATVAGQIAAAVLCLIMNLKKNLDVGIHLKQIRPHWAMVGEIYRIGFPSILMISIGSVLNFLLNQILIAFTTTATAVFGVYSKLQNFIFMPVFGLNNAMVPLISYNYGARQKERIHQAIRLTIFTAVAIMCVGTLLFELVPGFLLRLFQAKEHMLAIGIPALRIIGTHFALAGFCIIAGSVCQAIGNPLHSLLISICRQMLVLLPAAWLLSLSGRLELVWLAFPIAELVSLVLSAVFLKKTLRRVDSTLSAAEAA